MRHKRQGIRGRMARTVAAVALISLLVLGAAAASGLLRMRVWTLRINGDMGRQAAGDIRAILETGTMGQLTALAEAQAETVDANIRSIMSQVDVLAAAAEALYADPSAAGHVPVMPPSAAGQGVFAAQAVYAERTKPEDVAGEVEMLGCLTGQMIGISRFLEGAGTAQIGTESGIIIMCDENSGLKASMGCLDPVERSWYRIAADSGRTAWTEVFEDSYGRGLAVTCGKPVYGPEGELRAVVSVGSTLDDIGASVAGLRIGESGYALVTDRSARIILPGRTEETGSLGLRDLAAGGGADIRRVAEEIRAGRSGVARLVYDGAEVYMAYEMMESMPWAVVTVVEAEEILSPQRESERRISVLSGEAARRITGIIGSAGALSAAAAALAMALAAALGSAAAERVTRPLSRLTELVETISGGNLQTRVDIATGDELQTLAEAFNTMTASLRGHIRELTAVTAERERIGAELDVAARIQRNMLPGKFPPFPERREFDICAAMFPAREVGGDFYDFFMVDGDRLGVVMADVSGKGVPAALFMVVARTVIRNQALTGKPPGQVFDRANEQLYENNGESLFVTAFMGILDLRDGLFTYVNAGHTAPLIRRGGEYGYLRAEPGFVLAGLEGTTYKSGTIRLSAGDAVFLYTDGVTEAQDGGGSFFGEERLQSALNAPEARNLSPGALLRRLREDLTDFAGGAEQADDITMLALAYLGAGEEGRCENADGSRGG